MDIQNLRSQIDDIDEEITALFCKRMALSAQVAQYKQERGLPILAPQREKEVLEGVRQRSGQELGPYAAALYEKIMELSRQYQKERML